MGAFSNYQAQKASKPATVVLLKPENFCSTWPEAPRSDVAVGVRLLSELEVQQVKAEAAKQARAYYPDVEYDDELMDKAFQDELMKLAVARATTSPNDAALPYFPAPDDMIGEAWLPSTIRRLWDELERCTIERSPIARPAGDEDLKKLALLIEKGHVTKLADAQQLRLRKLMRFALEELEAVDEVYG